MPILLVVIFLPYLGLGVLIGRGQELCFHVFAGDPGGDQHHAGPWISGLGTAVPDTDQKYLSHFTWSPFQPIR